MSAVPEAGLSRKVVERASSGQRTKDLMFRLALLFSVSVGFVVLAALVLDVMIDGASRVSLDFITSFPSRISPESTGVKSALIGTIYLMVLCAIFAVGTTLFVMTLVLNAISIRFVRKYRQVYE